MLGFKRPAPNGCFLERPDSKLLNNGPSSVYETTFLKMRAPRATTENGQFSRTCQDSCFCRQDVPSSSANRTYSSSTFTGKKVTVDLASTSANCSEQTRPTCFHCRKQTCLICHRQCAKCGEGFCSVCSISDFNERYDRAFCWECNSTSCQ